MLELRHQEIFANLSKHEILYIPNITTIRKPLASRILLAYHRLAHRLPNIMHEPIRPLLKSTSNVSWQTHITLTDSRMLHAICRPKYDPYPRLPYFLLVDLNTSCYSSTCPIYVKRLNHIIIIEEENSGMFGLPNHYVTYNPTLKWMRSCYIHATYNGMIINNILYSILFHTVYCHGPPKYFGAFYWWFK